MMRSAEDIERIAGLEAERDALASALRDISKPVEKLQREAEEAGGMLDGHAALSLANDAEWLRGLAADALRRQAEEPLT